VNSTRWFGYWNGGKNDKMSMCSLIIFALPLTRSTFSRKLNGKSRNSGYLLFKEANRIRGNSS